MGMGVADPDHFHCATAAGVTGLRDRI